MEQLALHHIYKEHGFKQEVDTQPYGPLCTFIPPGFVLTQFLLILWSLNPSFYNILTHERSYKHARCHYTGDSYSIYIYIFIQLLIRFFRF